MSSRRKSSFRVPPSLADDVAARRSAYVRALPMYGIPFSVRVASVSPTMLASGIV